MYFNEIEPFAADWLGQLYPGATIDRRSIVDVSARDVVGFRRCHFFGGIGGWEYALHLAGWPAERSVWTGSCPCQPFSSAGKGLGTADARHLWPDLCRLIAQCEPATIFGEQVASLDGRQWVAGVRADLEALGYAVGVADLCAAGAGENAEGWIVRGDTVKWESVVLGAPHIRQRLFWVANANENGQRTLPKRELHDTEHHVESRSRLGGLADAERPAGRSGSIGRSDDRRQASERHESADRPGEHCETRGLGYANSERKDSIRRVQGWPRTECSRGTWSDFDIIYCRDNKYRRVESGSFPLVDGAVNRVGRLRGYGNAIVPQVAATFVKAFLESE